MGLRYSGRLLEHTALETFGMGENPAVERRAMSGRLIASMWQWTNSGHDCGMSLDHEWTESPMLVMLELF